MSKVDTSSNDECNDLTKTEKKKAPRSGGILKHIIFGSLIAVILGVSKYCFFDKLRLMEGNLDDLSVNSSHLEHAGNEQVIEHEVSTVGTFGEEELLPNENKVTLEQIPQEISPEDQDDEPMLNYDDETLNDEADSYDEEEEESEDGENESQMDSETLKKILNEDLHLELDEGFATKDPENGDEVEVMDDAGIEEYEHEAGVTDNNWSDDESELKRMEENKLQQL